MQTQTEDSADNYNSFSETRKCDISFSENGNALVEDTNGEEFISQGYALHEASLCPHKQIISIFAPVIKASVCSVEL